MTWKPCRNDCFSKRGTPPVTGRFPSERYSNLFDELLLFAWTNCWTNIAIVSKFRWYEADVISLLHYVKYIKYVHTADVFWYDMANHMWWEFQNLPKLVCFFNGNLIIKHMSRAVLIFTNNFCIWLWHLWASVAYIIVDKFYMMIIHLM